MHQVNTYLYAFFSYVLFFLQNFVASQNRPCTSPLARRKMDENNKVNDHEVGEQANNIDTVDLIGAYKTR